MALITIGIPVYNEEAFLAKTIESAIHQTFKDIRIIISDNCSSDRSYEIASNYAQQDSRIELIRQPENIGPTKNFLYSLDKADSKYFVWLGGHDIFCEHYIEEAIALLEQSSDVVMAYPKAIMIDVQDQEIGHADSDIDTTGLAMTERLLKIAENLFYCTSFHGVFRTDILRRLPCEQGFAMNDHLGLFMASSYGHIRMMNIIGIKRRQPRVETDQEVKNRWKNWGIHRFSDGISPYGIMTLKHIEHIWKHPSLSIEEKLHVSLGVKDIFAKRFGVLWTELLWESYQNLSTIPGLTESLVMESFRLDSASEISDYLRLDLAENYESVIHQYENLLKQQLVRLIHLRISAISDSVPVPIQDIFKRISQYSYECYWIESGKWGTVDSSHETYSTYIAVPKVSTQIASIILSMQAQLVAKQAVIEELHPIAKLAQQQDYPLLSQQIEQAHRKNSQIQSHLERVQNKLKSTQEKLKRTQIIAKKLQQQIAELENSWLWKIKKALSRLKHTI